MPGGSDWYSTRLSNRTQAILADCVSRAYTHTELDNLFQRLDAVGADENEWGSRGNKLDRCHNVVAALTRRDPEGGTAVLALLRELLEVKWESAVISATGKPTPRARPLLEALRTDGFEFVNGRLVSSTPAPVAVAPELSLLEHELLRRELLVAQTHYRQAVDSFTEGRLEASNGQLRSFLEDLTTSLAERVTGRAGSDPRGAVQRLRNGGYLDPDEARVLEGLIGVSNRNGCGAVGVRLFRPVNRELGYCPELCGCRFPLWRATSG